MTFARFLGCFRRFRLRARVGGPWSRFRAPLIEPEDDGMPFFVERLVGTFRRELTDHLIVLGERHLLRSVRAYMQFYERRPTTHVADENQTSQVDRRGTEVLALQIQSSRVRRHERC